jgi:hypothetical protein
VQVSLSSLFSISLPFFFRSPRIIGSFGIKLTLLATLGASVRKLIDKINFIRHEVTYQRSREEEFRNTSESTNGRVMWYLFFYCCFFRPLVSSSSSLCFSHSSPVYQLIGIARIY